MLLYKTALTKGCHNLGASTVSPNKTSDGPMLTWCKDSLPQHNEVSKNNLFFIFFECINENLSANDQQEVKGRRRVSPINKCIPISTTSLLDSFYYYPYGNFFLLLLVLQMEFFFFSKTCVRTSDFIQHFH